MVKELVRKFGRLLRDQGSAHCVPAVTLTSEDHVTYCLTHGQPIHSCATQDRSGNRRLEAGLQVQRAPSMRHTMKPAMFLAVGAVLVAGLLKSPPCMAQAEIAPDHFDSPSTEPASVLGSVPGTFTLLHQVNCAGLTLPAGAYSLSIRSLDGATLVTLTPARTMAGAAIQARVESLSTADHPIALILERIGQQRVLVGFALQDSGTVLRLRGVPSQPVPWKSEMVPIVYATRPRAAN